MNLRTCRTALSCAILVTLSPLSAFAQDAGPAADYRPPHVVPYEGGSIPPYSHLEDRTNMSLISPGVVIAGTAYGFSLLYALGTCGAQMQCRNGSAWLYVPFFGPYYTSAQAPTSGGTALSAFDAGVQTLGLGLIVAGLVMPKRVVVWQDANVAVRVAPSPMANGAGLVLSVTNL